MTTQAGSKLIPTLCSWCNDLPAAIGFWCEECAAPQTVPAALTGVSSSHLDQHPTTPPASPVAQPALAWLPKSI